MLVKPSNWIVREVLSIILEELCGQNEACPEEKKSNRFGNHWKAMKEFSSGKFEKRRAWSFFCAVAPIPREKKELHPLLLTSEETTFIWWGL